VFQGIEVSTFIWCHKAQLLTRDVEEQAVAEGSVAMPPSILEEPGDTILLRNAAEEKPTAVVGVRAVAAAPLLL